MGSEKYPRENDFDDYVSQRDGSSNACTDGEYTMFYFDIQRRHFKPSLDKFANFFVAPLLSETCVDRELEAVHSEFELAKANDSWRLDQVIASQAKESSPYRTFGCGTSLFQSVLFPRQPYLPEGEPICCWYKCLRNVAQIPDSILQCSDYDTGC